MDKKIVFALIVVAVLVVGVSAVLASTQVFVEKPEFHLFNIEVTGSDMFPDLEAINSGTYPVDPKLVTFNIQNIGDVPATDVQVDFIFTINSSLVEGGEFEYAYTYHRDVLESKEVQDGFVLCGVYGIIEEEHIFPKSMDDVPIEIIQKMDNLDDVAFQLMEEASVNSNNILENPLDPDELTQMEKEALIFVMRGWPSYMQPSHYIISCAEGVVEKAPFP